MDLQLRQAVSSDLDKTFEWANDPISRQSSFNTQAISFETHASWFTEKLKNENCVYLILTADGVYAGQIRYDKTEDFYLISFLIDIGFRGQGLGTALLKKGEEYLTSVKDTPITLIGYVKKINLPSIKAFERNDYEMEEVSTARYIATYLFRKQITKAAKLALLVSGDLGLKTLKLLYDTQDVVCVFTDSNSNLIINWCELNKIPLFRNNPRSQGVLEFLSQFDVDIVFSINYLFLIDKSVIRWPRLIAFNIHGSLLPKYRGRTPHVWAIINNEKLTGFTIHVIDEGCDTGDIVFQKEIEISSEMTGGSILKEFEKLYPSAIKNVIFQATTGSLNLRPQDGTKATYYGKRTPYDGNIDWEWQKERIFNWVRAQTKPYPGAYTFYKNEKVIIYKIMFDEHGFNYKHENGVILHVDDGQPIVKTGNGAIRILEFASAVNIKFKKGEKLHAGDKD